MQSYCKLIIDRLVSLTLSICPQYVKVQCHMHMIYLKPRPCPSRFFSAWPLSSSSPEGDRYIQPGFDCIFFSVPQTFFPDSLYILSFSYSHTVSRVFLPTHPVYFLNQQWSGSCWLPSYIPFVLAVPKVRYGCVQFHLIYAFLQSSTIVNEGDWL